MKFPILIAYFLLCCFVFLSCNNFNKEKALIVEAKSLVNIDPDSAMHLIMSIHDPQKPGYEFYMQYILLQVQIKDKLKQDIANDSNIILASNYFSKKNQQEEAAIASFYTGKMYLEQGQEKEAMKHLLQARQYASLSHHSQLLGLSCYYIGELYKKETCLEVAIHFFKLSEKYFLQINDTTNAAYAIYETADCYRIQDQLDEALNNYEKILPFSNTTLIPTIFAHMGHLYLEKQNLQEAKIWLLKAIEYEQETEQKAYNMLILSDMFKGIGCLDSCAHYLAISKNTILNSDDHFLKAKYFLTCSQINESMQDFREALQDYKTYEIYYDSLNIVKERKTIFEITKKYDAEKLESNYKSKIIKHQYFILTGLVIMIICLIIIFYYAIKHNRMKNHLLETEFTMATLTKNTTHYNAIEHKMKDLVLEKIELSKQVSLLNWIGNVDEKSVKKINELIHGEYIKDFNWERLYQLLNDLYDNFSDKLQHKCHFLSESERQFCCLLKANYTTGEIAFVMNIQTDSVRMKKMRIRKLCGLRNQEDIVNFLDQFIKEE